MCEIARESRYIVCQPQYCTHGSNWEQFVWTYSTQLLPQELLGAILLDQFHPIAPAGAIGSNSFGPIPPNCSRGSIWEQFVWTNSTQLLPREQLGEIRLDQFLPIAPMHRSNRELFVWTYSSQLIRREQLGAIRLDKLLPIAPAGAIGSNSFGPIASNCFRGSNWEQFVWTYSSQLLQREQLGAIRLDQLLPIAPAGAIGSNLLLREQLGAIRLDQFHPFAPAGAIGSNSFGPIPPNCSRGSNWEQFVWTNSTQLFPR